MPVKQNVYANVRLEDSDLDYLWVRAWNSGGKINGMVDLGDMAGKHNFSGIPTKVTIAPDGSTGQVEAVGVYVADAPHGGVPVAATVLLNLQAGSQLSFEVQKLGLDVWQESNVAYPAGSVLFY
jgi:hypothetical protein